MIDKVIKGLTECVKAGLEKACPTDCPYFLQCFPDVGPADPFVPLMQDALALLKEKEPKFVQNIGQQLSCKSGTCPNCGKMLNTIGNRHFCGKCGQAVKWE